MLSFVTKFTLKPLRQLTDAEALALYWVFIKGKGTAEQRQLALSLVDWQRRNDAWFACDCQQSHIPVLTSGLKLSGKYYLQHIEKRGQHASSCRFAGISRPSQQHSQRRPTTQLPVSRVLNLHRQGNEATDSDGDKRPSSGSGTSQRLSTLARLLYTLIVETGLNQIAPKGPLALTEQYAVLRQRLRQCQLAKGIDGRELTTTYPSASLIRTLKKQRHRFPKTIRPYGICVSVIDQMAEQRLSILSKNHDPQEIICQGKITRSSGRLGERSAPYLSILTMSDSVAQPYFYHWQKAYIVPVAGKHLLVPVDSHYERLVLTALIKWQKWWLKEGLSITIEKPLFDIPVIDANGTEQTCLPDFLLHTPTRILVIEVQGSREADYQDRKVRTHALMQRLGELYAFDADVAEQSGNFNETLKQFLKGISANLFADKEDNYDKTNLPANKPSIHLLQDQGDVQMGDSHENGENHQTPAHRREDAKTDSKNQPTKQNHHGGNHEC